MVSTFHGLETGKRALSVGQASIATTGHNIANANTKGYSRQQVNQSTSPSLDIWTNSTNPGQLGSGVSIDSITRVRDRFLDNQHRDQSATLADAQTKQAAFDRLEGIINEPSDAGLNSAMDQLRNAWQDLSNNPDSASAQAVVKERAQAFVEVAQSMDSSMENMKLDLDQQKAAAVTEANDYLKQIASLNDSIVRGGNTSNDLKDQRDVLVEKLSALAPIKVDAQANGSYTISLKQPEGEPDLKMVEGNSVTEEIADGTAVTGGKIAGLISAENKVQENHEKLIDVATKFAEANNETIDGDPLFSNTASIAEMEVNVEATLGTPTADMEVGIKEAKTAYQELVSVLGVQSQSATRSVANFEATLQATENRRQSVSGVSLDEEMANLVKFQHSYSAAARLISTADQMLDTIINRMAAR
ncbi:flagellar hook-associated protein FlgK [Planococcus salinarum]|uniref:flagellar hook-associated protein FlgK n=1 Tax=Planococcus salinarum TaxID=622695 RepID=UPI000E3CD7CE|nr:flagellar hook-associated protein FlgK [Planococcus salinarum]TAA72224.1 flagellar hook-associated protein FlgK [Planococcus salinarum]